MKAAFEDSVFLVSHDSYVGTLSELEGNRLIKGAADIAFRIRTFFSVFETKIGSEFVCLRVCDDVTCATSEEFGLAAIEGITSRISLSGT